MGIQGLQWPTFSLVRAESSFAVVSCSQAAAIGTWSDAIDAPEGGRELA